MLFWIIASLIVALVAATLLPPLLRPMAPAPTQSPDMGVYRDQLAEVDRDLARGVLDAAEAERTRTEIARRLLAADSKTSSVSIEASAGVNRKAVAVVSIGLVVGSLLTYAGTVPLLKLAGYNEAGISSMSDRTGFKWRGIPFNLIFNGLGAPGYPDISRASRIAAGDAMRDGRMDQAAAEALVPVTLATDVPAADMTLIDQLRTAVRDHPDQVQGWGFLAEYEARIGNYPAAARAQERLIALKGDTATVADYEYLVDVQVTAAGGFVSPEVELTLRRLLADDEKNITARYYTGLLYAQTDRPDIAFRLWRDLVTDGPADDVHVQLARGGVQDAAVRAGVDYELPPEVGPSAADITAAQGMTPEAQQAMIRGMVGQLSDRLASQGGPPADWARLISSLGVLGDTDQARAIWTEAQGVFAADPAAMAQLLAAAQSAGIAE